MLATLHSQCVAKGVEARPSEAIDRGDITPPMQITGTAPVPASWGSPGQLTRVDQAESVGAVASECMHDGTLLAIASAGNEEAGGP
jgi:hypothetical protein